MLILCQKYEEANGGRWVDMKLPMTQALIATQPPLYQRHRLEEPVIQQKLIDSPEAWADTLTDLQQVGKYRAITNDGRVAIIVISARTVYDMDVQYE